MKWIAVILALLVARISVASATGIQSQDPLIVNMISKIDEANIYSDVYCLQNFTTRYWGYSGSIEASTWLYDKLSNISALDVEYQGGKYRNVIATLPGLDPTSTAIYIVGAHYDSETNSDLSHSPGATIALDKCSYTCFLNLPLQASIITIQIFQPEAQCSP